jgi:hypothetical protein
LPSNRSIRSKNGVSYPEISTKKPGSLLTLPGYIVSFSNWYESNYATALLTETKVAIVSHSPNAEATEAASIESTIGFADFMVPIDEFSVPVDNCKEVNP